MTNEKTLSFLRDLMDQIISFCIKHWPLCVSLITIILLIIANEFLNKKQQGKSLSPQAVINLINHQKAIIFDLRPIDAYNKGHIINALHTTFEELQQQKMSKHKTKSVILVCTKGIQAAALAPKVRALGFNEVIVLSGGISAWQNENLPLIKGASK